MNTADKDLPALLGGPPAFADGLRFVKPSTPALELVVARLRPSYEDGHLTNGVLVRLLEEQAADRLGTRYAVAVSCCTAGLILVLQALDLDGPVVLPSFTFSASAHAIVWNGLAPVFAECDPRTFQLDADDAAGRLDDASALMATHVFGAPCIPERMEELAATKGVPLIFDAAHGFGATRKGRPIGSFGLAEVFSLSPTKVVVAGEGGIVSTDDEGLAQTLRIARDYGNPGDYDTRFVGLNARLSEFHAAMALESMNELDEHLEDRRSRARRYGAGLIGVPGVELQAVDSDDQSTYKDFTVAIDESRFGLSRDQLVKGLRSEGIDTRCYFSPPVHRQQSYSNHRLGELPVTDDVSGRVVSLPFYRSLTAAAVDKVCACILALHERADEVRASSG